LITPLVILPDDVRLSDIEPRFTCQACGPGKAADVPPGFRPGRNGWRGRGGVKSWSHETIFQIQRSRPEMIAG
jgi:hypothetical protein